MGCLLISYID